MIIPCLNMICCTIYGSKYSSIFSCRSSAIIEFGHKMLHPKLDSRSGSKQILILKWSKMHFGPKKWLIQSIFMRLIWIENTPLTQSIQRPKVEQRCIFERLIVDQNCNLTCEHKFRDCSKVYFRSITKKCALELFHGHIQEVRNSSKKLFTKSIQS